MQITHTQCGCLLLFYGDICDNYALSQCLLDVLHLLQEGEGGCEIVIESLLHQRLAGGAGRARVPVRTQTPVN